VVGPVGGGDADVATGLGVIVLVTHGCGVATGRAAPAGPSVLELAMVTAVVAMTAPAMHRPVATLATADPCLRTLTRLTPFQRSSVEGSSFTRHSHTMRYLPVVPAARAVPGGSFHRPAQYPRSPMTKCGVPWPPASASRAVTWK
jgi:hypothetical protein